MNQALIIGASGLVGNYLHKLAPADYRVSGTFRNFPLPGLLKLEITDKNEVKSLILGLKPQTVFLPAAFTNVDICEDDPGLCHKVNVESIRNIADILSVTGAMPVYFSTDYIFDGSSGPYSEVASPCPLGTYGRSKLEAEEAIKRNLKNYLIIRTTCVYGWEHQEKNFVVNLIKKAKSGKIIEVPSDQITTPTYAGHLACLTWGLVSGGAQGTYNVAGATLMSRFDFALLAAEVFGLDKNLIKPITTQEMSRKARRPLNAGLKITKISEELKRGIPGAEEGLKEMKKEMGNGRTL
ncbi:MAG: SDR family oxidoreductase [Candidatus Omnitrophota bacterium]